MHNITWEEVLRGDSIQVYLCFTFFTTVLVSSHAHSPPCWIHFAKVWPAKGGLPDLSLPWHTWIIFLNNFPLSLKKTGLTS